MEDIEILFLDRVTGVITDEQGRAYALARARELWELGKVHNYNLAFGRLIGENFDLERVVAYYAARRVAQAQQSEP